MKILISGGGIGGLTTALTAKKAKHTPIIIQKRIKISQQTFGGGIGLWPPSQLVFQRLNLLQKIKQLSFQMPQSYYLNHQGKILGQPTSNFPNKFRILCLERQKLCKILQQQCRKQSIQIKTGKKVQQIINKQQQKIKLILSNGQKIQGDILVGADGINSFTRQYIHSQNRLNIVSPKHCGYSYFRSVIDISKVQYQQKWHKCAFQSWGNGIRFGYVPLKYPKVFWFLAIPIGHDGLKVFQGSKICLEYQKQWLIKQIKQWKAPISLQKIILLTNFNSILRSDIHKVPIQLYYPWYNKQKNIFLVGDSANATAPNLAQGAGLAIQSAWDLISLVNFQSKHGYKYYQKRRLIRALKVQKIADSVASIGQQKDFLYIRDQFMINANKYLGNLQKKVFEYTVILSLGGSFNNLYWKPKLNNQYLSFITFDQFNYSHFKKLGINSQLIQDKYKIFKSLIIGNGKGKVTTKTNNLFKFLGFPQNMQNQPFQAFIHKKINKQSLQLYQQRVRIFGSGNKNQIKYSTQHHLITDLNQKNGIRLFQTINNNIFGRNIGFGYDIKIQRQNIKFDSIVMCLRKLKLKLPQILTPKSSYIQKQNSLGWQFQGKICLPKILGSLPIFQYKGHFEPEWENIRTRKNNKKVIIAGGTGFIGKYTAIQFYNKGWDVAILSRKNQVIKDLVFAQLIIWNPSCNNQQKQQQIKRISKQFQNVDIVINLAGQNPGRYWTQKNKNLILKSRLECIQIITQALKMLKKQNITYIQASAVGIYGNRGNQVLNQQSNISKQNNFRVNTCNDIQKLTLKNYPKAIIARLGHALAKQDGFYKYINIISQLFIRKIGNGDQYIPWIHVTDAARSLYFISQTKNLTGSFINIVNPNTLTSTQMLQKIGSIYNRNRIIQLNQQIIKFILNQISCVILDSIRINPTKLIQIGFKFKYDNLQKAIYSKQLF